MSFLKDRNLGFGGRYQICKVDRFLDTVNIRAFYPSQTHNV